MQKIQKIQNFFKRFREFKNHEKREEYREIQGLFIYGNNEEAIQKLERWLLK
ncbi:hypothetical protein [Helicobacter kayseriensis]|uniref:hypothetical protein n=1 Tax=Helicobacter kayseriensis TaxID=2905877 RepID=UPI001E2BC2BF|nr:hypothetical protein [Helicobacter kayseriensis]MCE3046633.1 hypothetical protein [Helicobacter kayseriensis]